MSVPDNERIAETELLSEGFKWGSGLGGIPVRVPEDGTLVLEKSGFMSDLQASEGAGAQDRGAVPAEQVRLLVLRSAATT